MQECPRCGAQVEKSQLMFTEAGEVCDACHAGMSEPSTGAPPMAIAALVAAVIPFFMSVNRQSSVTVNGQTTGSYMDYVALTGGSAAVILGAIALLPLVRATPRNNRALALVVGAVVLGLVQLLRAFGKLG